MGLLTLFRLALYFIDLLMNNFRQIDFFTVIFDEAFNNYTPERAGEHICEVSEGR